MFQDHDGIIWLGTKGGVSRYDGYNVQTFRSNITSPNLLSSNNVLTMAENNDCYLLGTVKGLDVLDKRTFKTRKLPFADVNNVEIRSVVVDRKGNVWVGTYRTLLRLSPDLTQCEDMSRHGVPRTSVNDIYADRQGNVWAMFWEKGLYRYDERKQKFVPTPPIGKRNNPFRMIEYGNGRYIISTWGNGLYSMDSRQRVAKIANDAKYDNVLSCIFGIVPSSHNGMLWLVESNTLVYARLEGGRIEPVDRKDMGELLHKQFNSIYRDRDGNVWANTKDDSFFRISTDRGTFAFIPIGSNMAYGSSRPYVTSLFDAGDGLWYSVSGRGVGFDANNGSSLTITPPLDNSDASQLQNITSICQPSFLPKNRVWMLLQYQSRIYEMEHTPGGLRIAKNINIGIPGLPQALFEDSKGNVWLSTNIGMAVLQRGMRQFRRVPQITYDDIYSIAEDNNGYVWFASQSHGLTRVRTDMRGHGGLLAITEKHVYNAQNSPLPTDHTEALAFDRTRHRLWIGLGEGFVYSYDPKNGSFADHSQIMEGGIRGDIVNLVPDPHGRIWISTTTGIVRYDPAQGSINVYSSGDMGVNDFAKNAFSLSDRGECLIFAGRGGAVCLSTNWQRATRNWLMPPIVSDIKVGGMSIYKGLDDNFYMLDNHSRTLHLGSDARNIEIDFTACEYSQQRRVFAYMMEGIDRTWNYCGEGRASAYYSEIPSGSHRLLIRSTDGNGQWAKDVTIYNVYKKPHLWETWWAYLLYASAVVAIACLAFIIARQRIAERQRRQIDRIERQKEEELVQTKLRYFTNVSHDFLTPITVIPCIIDDMKSSAKVDLAQFDHIRANLNRLRQLIQQVLDFRKMENGKMTLSVSVGCLNRFVADVCGNYFEPLTNKKDIRFSVNLPKNESVNGYFDSDKVEKIIVNLLSNAFKYTDHGEISVTLSQVLHDGKHIARIDVADTGAGIARKDIDHIFDRFFTAQSSRTDSNGVGLSLVKDIAELHHAKISVESTVGQGSTFTLMLPLDADSYLPTELAERTDAADRLELRDDTPDNTADATMPSADDRTMLIVEDNEELLTLMRGIFARYHNVVCATNGEEGLRMAHSEHPDIIVSDVMMPVMDGLQMCRALKSDAETSHIPLILLTARTTAADRVECYEAGADGYIAKPFELEVLKARIENFLRTRHARQQEFRTETTSAPLELQMSALDKNFMDKAMKEIRRHLSDDGYDIGQLAESVCMSKSTLYRKMKSLTGMSPIEFLRSERLKLSRKMIEEEKERSISDIACACGFSTLRYFSRCFKDEFGVAPSELRKLQ